MQKTRTAVVIGKKLAGSTKDGANEQLEIDVQCVQLATRDGMGQLL